jgi:hypothetical protein
MTSWNDLEKAINDNGYDFDGYHLTKDGNATNEHVVKWEHFEVEGKDFIRVVRDNDDDNRLYALDFANHAVYQKWELDEETIGKFKYELTITSFDLVTAYQFLPNNKIEEFFSKYKTEEERENAIRTFINDLITATELKEDDTTSDNGGSEESAESATSSNTSFAIPVTESMTFYEFEIEKEYDGIDIKKDLHTLEGGKVVSKEYEFDLEKGEWVEETHDDYILTAGGWVKESGLEETYVLNSDGSATIDDGFVVGIEEAIDLGNTTFTEAGSDGIEIAVSMPAGATMYKNSYTTLVDQYRIWDKKSVWVDGNRTEVTSFDELIQSQCGLNWFRGYSNGGIAFAPSSNEDGTFAKDNNGNYICNTAASSGTLVEVKRNADGSVNIVDENAGQWSIETVSGQQILVVRPENEAYYKDSDGEVEYPIFAMYDGAIWEGEMEPAGMTMTWTSYNETAFNALVNYVETHYKEIASFDTDDSVSDSNVTDENASTMFKFTADYLTGRTLYLVTYDDFGDENNLQWNMASLAFDSDKFVWHEYDTNDSGYYDVPYTLTPEGYIQFTGTDEENRTTTGTVEPVEYSDDYIKVCETEDNGDRTIQNCSSYFFFDEAKAIAFRDNQNGNNGVSDSNVTDENASTTSTTTDYIYITEEMLDGRVFNEKMNEDDGGYGYAKMTPTATDATRHEIWYNSDGSVREDNTFSVPFELIDGKLRAETPEEYKWFTLMKEDETAWYLINDDDVDKDGTIDQAGEENIWYLSKPADFPENL